MTVTASGLVTQRFPEILQGLQNQLINVSGNPNLDLSDSSILGILNTVYANASASEQALIQAVYAAGDIGAAEGVNLDRLVAYIGLTRLAGRKSNGFLYFTSTTVPATVPAGTKVVSVNRDVALTTSVLRINTDLCYGALLDFTVQNSTVYTINLNGTNYTYTSDIDATKSEIASGLAALIINPTISAEVDVSNRLKITTTSGTNGIRILLGTTNVQIVSLTSRVAGEAETEAATEFLNGTIVRLQTPISNLSVTNLQTWAVGAARESDEDLRARHAASTQLIGLRTEAAIIARVLAVEGVEKALLRDNVLDTTDVVTGLPAHSFEVVVKGGADLDIATAILYTKSAGIQTYGSVSQNVTDEDGILREINFSRATPVYIWVKVQYELYVEEPTPSEVEALITDQVFQYGSNLDLGEDVIPTRFLPPIYSNINGLGIVNVLIAETVDPITPPVSYAATTIEIGEFEESNFSLARIIVEELP